MQPNERKHLDQLNKDYNTADLYKELIVCSNTLIDTKHILSDDSGWHPLVIRKGLKPRIWLSIQAQENTDASQEEDEFIELIADSQLMYADAELTNTEYGFQVVVNNQIVVEAGNHKPDSLEVIKLDLRPFGMNIYGDHLSLSVGNNTMSRNTSSGGHSMFGIG